jgi:hypothetical protein
VRSLRRKRQIKAVDQVQRRRCWHQSPKDGRQSLERLRVTGVESALLHCVGGTYRFDDGQVRLCAALAVDPNRPYRAQSNFGAASNISRCDALVVPLFATRSCRRSQRNAGKSKAATGFRQRRFLCMRTQQKIAATMLLPSLWHLAGKRKTSSL